MLKLTSQFSPITNLLHPQLSHLGWLQLPLSSCSGPKRESSLWLFSLLHPASKSRRVDFIFKIYLESGHLSSPPLPPAEATTTLNRIAVTSFGLQLLPLQFIFRAVNMILLKIKLTHYFLIKMLQGLPRSLGIKAKALIVSTLSPSQLPSDLLLSPLLSPLQPRRPLAVPLALQMDFTQGLGSPLCSLLEYSFPDT